jgi:tetratricopeptide (TPR) repeat protein
MVSRVYSPVYANRSGQRAQRSGSLAPQPGSVDERLAGQSSATEQPTTRQDGFVKTADNAKTTSSSVTESQAAESVAEPSTAKPSQDTRTRPELATLRDQAEGRRIQLDSVLSDFEQTINALGLHQQVSDKVQPYLTVVRLQGQADKPNVGLIKSALLSASQTMDAEIAQLTKQPSTVVNEWMQTLLEQDIAYISHSPLTPSPVVTAASATVKRLPASADNAFANGLATAPQSVENGGKRALKQWLQSARQLPPAQAIPLLQQALPWAEQSNPEWAGQVNGMLARRYWQQGQTPAALEHMQQAIALTADPLQAAHQSVVLANWQQQLKLTDQVVTTLAPVLTQPGWQQLGPKAQTRAWLDYGSALNELNQTDDAVTALQQGAKLAKQYGQGSWLTQTLPTLAQALLKQGKPQSAFRVLGAYQQRSKGKNA